MNTTTFVYNASDIETCQPVSVADIVSTISSKRKAWTLPRIYRRQLKLYRTIARWTEAHPRLSNALLYVESAVAVYILFMYA